MRTIIQLLIFAIVMLLGTAAIAQTPVYTKTPFATTPSPIANRLAYTNNGMWFDSTLKATKYAGDSVLMMFNSDGVAFKIPKNHFLTSAAIGDYIQWSDTNTTIATKSDINNTTSYTAYNFNQGAEYEDTARDGMAAFSISGRFGLAGGWYEFAEAGKTTTNKVRYTSDFITWTTVLAPWRQGHAFGSDVYLDTFYKYGNDYGNDFLTYDMSAWRAYFVGSTLTFEQLDDSMDIPPTILFGSCVDDSGYHYIIGGQDKFTIGAVMRNTVYRTRDFITYELRATISGIGGNKWGCVTYRDGTIYVISGGIYLPSRTYTDTVIALTNGGATATYLAPFPGIAVQYPTSVLDTATQRIYFSFGSNVTEGGNQNQIYFLDTANKWYEVIENNVPSRHAASGALHNGDIVYAGGQMYTSDVWISDFTTESYTGGLSNAIMGEILIGDNADYLLGLTDGKLSKVSISQNFASLTEDNTFTGINTFTDGRFTQLGIYPASAINGASRFSNTLSEPINGVFTQGITWRDTTNQFLAVLRSDPPTGNAFGVRITTVPTTSASLVLAISSGAGNGTIHHSWRGDGSYYNATRFAYSTGDFQISVFNIATGRREYITNVPFNKGGTGLSALGTAGQVMKVNAGATALEYGNVAWTEVTGKPTTITAAGFTDVSTTNVNNSVARRDGSGYLTATHYIAKDTTHYNVAVGGIPVRKLGEEFLYTNDAQPVNRFLSVLVNTSSGSVSMSSTTNTNYVFNGTTSTFTLPAISATRQLEYTIKNIGSGNITLNTTAAASYIYDASAVNTLTIPAGGSIRLLENGTYFTVIRLPTSLSVSDINDVTNTAITVTGSLSSTKPEVTRLIDATAGNITLTLNALSGQKFNLTRVDGSANTVTIQMQSGNINGVATFGITNTPYLSYTFIFNGTQTTVH